MEIVPPLTGEIGDLGGAGTHPALGLVTAAPGTDSIRFGWRSVDLPSTAPAAALFVSEDAGDVLAGTPHTVDASALDLTVEGLTRNVEYFAALAWDDGEGGWERSGPVLRARTGPRIYVRSGANAAIADGRTPATAWPSLEEALAVAAIAAPINVWVHGSFSGVEATVPAGVAVYGGFSESLTLAERDVIAHKTELVGAGSAPVVLLARADDSVAVFDGFLVDGAGLSAACVEVDQRWAELRSVGVGRADRGFKLRSLDLSNPVEVSLVRCAASVCNSGGMSISGSFNILMEDCSMSNNGQEGLTADDLLGLGSEVSRIEARDCLFEGNGAEGFDVDLATSGQLNSGRWVVRLEDCEFLRNQGAGCLVDCDYEGETGWFARIELEGCVARDNGGPGVHLDLDAQATTYLHRLSLAANAGDGLLITSESAHGTALLESSVLHGNHGFGARTEMGNVGLLVSHSILAGNRAGGVKSGVAPILVTSSVAFGQAAPWGAGESHFSLNIDMAPPLPFLRAPRGWLLASAASEATVTLSAQPPFGAGAVLEWADDGVESIALSVGGDQVEFAPPPHVIRLPASVTWFDAGPVVEDWRPSASSPALGAGMSSQGGPALDAGPFGAARGGTPGRLELIPQRSFRFAETVPSWSGTISSSETLVLRFDGGVLDAASSAGAVTAVGPGGALLTIDVFAAGGSLIVSPPPGGWPAEAVLRVHETLRSLGGQLLSAPVAIPLTRG